MTDNTTNLYCIICLSIGTTVAPVMKHVTILIVEYVGDDKRRTHDGHWILLNTVYIHSLCTEVCSLLVLCLGGVEKDNHQSKAPVMRGFVR